MNDTDDFGNERKRRFALSLREEKSLVYLVGGSCTTLVYFSLNVAWMQLAPEKRLERSFTSQVFTYSVMIQKKWEKCILLPETSNFFPFLENESTFSYNKLLIALVFTFWKFARCECIFICSYGYFNGHTLVRFARSQLFWRFSRVTSKSERVSSVK